jgi:(R,R)-butanediol dehydrogenase / meso-butanediol dehydrogenase / diacetyl reductase
VLAQDQAIVLESPGKFRVRMVPDLAPAPGEVTVEPAYVGLCGTDLHIAAGTHPRAAFPLILGHEIVGLAAGGRWAGQPVLVDPTISCGGCAACARGDGHVCERLRLVGIDRDGGLAGRVSVAEARLHPLPAGLPLAAAALAEPLAVAVHAAGRAGPYLGALVVILGGGPIGLLTGMVARAAGAREVVIAEPAAVRKSAADELGFETAADARSLPGGADVVFDAAGAPDTAAEATRLVRPRGTIVVEGVHGAPAAVDLQTVTFAELTMTGTRVYRPEDLRVALALLAGGALDVRPLVSDVVDPEEVPDAFRRLERGESLKVLVRCGGQP